MTDPLEHRASRAAAAVRDRTRDLPMSDDVTRVRRRARRPAVAVLAVLLAAVLAVPVGLWLIGGGDSQIEFEPADPPVEESTPTPTPTPTEDVGGGIDPAQDPAPAQTSPEDPDAEELGDPEVEEDTDGPDGPEPVGDFSTAERSTPDFPYDGEGFAQLLDVRVASHEGFDRIVLEFGPDDDVPSYRITYVDPPVIQDGSGEEMRIEGAAFLELRMTPASGLTTETDDPSGWERTYDGPLRIPVGSGTVTELVRVDDWEANLSWILGVERTAPFSVEWLSSPRRLVVDVAHR
jgi:hypothetical protein